jgi:polyhydroxyalkanoate synthesis regulator phasin
MIPLWTILPLIPVAVILAILVRRWKGAAPKHKIQAKNGGILVQLATLEERTKQLQGLEEKIERIEDKQDSDSRELRDRLYNEYSTRLQDAVELLKDTYGKMNTTTANAFKEITSRNSEVYKQTATQLINMTEKLESAFKMLEEKEHAQMRGEMEGLKRKIIDLERDPLRVQLEELGEARTAQAVHEQSVKKITTIFWPNNGEVKFREKIGQYVPDVFITNHKVKIVADEVTTEDVGSIREKVRKIAEYMRGLNANIGYVIIPNAGVDPEALREIKRTVSERGEYVVRISEFAIHLQVWYDVATTGVIDMSSLVEKGHNFLQVLEPIFEEFIAIVQNLEQRDERDFKYRQNRYKEVKFFPGKLLETIEKASRTPD